MQIPSQPLCAPVAPCGYTSVLDERDTHSICDVVMHAVEAQDGASSSNDTTARQRKCSTEGNWGIELWDVHDLIGKNFLFFESQKSGELPEGHRVKWRGDSYVCDKFPDKDIDLSGGWHNGGGMLHV